MDEASSEGSSIQRQAQALGDQTRYRIFRYVADATEPARVADLAAELGLNHNGIRQHLTKLCAAGLLVEERAAPTGPGRPPRQYRLAPSAAARWTSPGPYRELALVLLDMQRIQASPRAAGAAAGQRLTSDSSAEDAVDYLEREMTRRGFQPVRVQRDSAIELVLGRCGVVDAASVAPDVVCEIHRGLVEGMLATAGGDYRLSELTRKDPASGGCALRVKRGGD